MILQPSECSPRISFRGFLPAIHNNNDNNMSNKMIFIGFSTRNDV